MRQFWIILLLCCIQLGFAQPAEFSARDLQEVSAASTRAQPTFFYRVQSEGALRYYQITFSTQLYQGMRVFLWPEAIPMAKRAETPLFGSDEILFNNKLVLCNSDALYFKSDTGMVALEKISAPGILYLRTNSPATYQSIDRRGIEPEEPLPAMIYTWNDTTKPCLLRSTGHIPLEFDPYTPTNTFRIFDATLDTVPRIARTPRVPANDWMLAPVDSALHMNLVAHITERKNELLNDSLHFQAFLDSLRTNYPQAMTERSYEDSTDYISRQRVRDVEARGLVSQAYSANAFGKSLDTLREQIVGLQFHLKQVEQELAEEREPHHALLHQQVWNHGFISLSMPLGQNLPAWTRNNGPRNLWGLGAQISTDRRLLGLWTLELQAQGGRTQWSNAYPARPCFENWAGLGVDVGYPILASFANHFTWMMQGGLHTTFRYTRAHDATGTEMRQGTTAGADVGSSLYFAHLPIRFNVNYAYDLDHFGDLRMSLGIPLPWIGGRRP